MADAHILIIVDTQASLKNPENPVVYLVDDDPTEDSGQGTLQLTTHVPPEGKVTWKPVAINNDDTVELSKFEDKGEKGFFKVEPCPEKGDVEGAWTGEVGNHPKGTKSSYGFYFKINGAGNFYFDPDVEIQPTSDNNG